LTLLDPRDLDDWYSISVRSGDALVLGTRTPADGPGEFVNLLDPHIELYDPTGALVASGTPLADGRNEQINYTALATGQYRVRVTPDGNSTGDYVLTVHGATGALPPFQVAATDPADGARLRGPVTQMTVDFNDTVLLTSLQASD